MPVRGEQLVILLPKGGLRNFRDFIDRHHRILDEYGFIQFRVHPDDLLTLEDVNFDLLISGCNNSKISFPDDKGEQILRILSRQQIVNIMPHLFELQSSELRGRLNIAKEFGRQQARFKTLNDADGKPLLDLDFDFPAVENSVREKHPNLEGEHLLQAINRELQAIAAQMFVSVFDEFDKLHHGSKEKCALANNMLYLIIGSKVRFRNEDKLGVDFDKLENDVLEEKFAHMSGINESWVYVAPHFSFFCDHLEDGKGLNSANLVLGGAGAKVWRIVRPTCLPKLMERVIDYFTLHGLHLDISPQEQSPFIRKLLMMSPRLLDMFGVEYTYAVQRRGDLIVTGSRGLHMGINVGSTVAKAVNLTSLNYFLNYNQFPLSWQSAVASHGNVKQVLLSEPNAPQDCEGRYDAGIISQDEDWQDYNEEEEVEGGGWSISENDAKSLLELYKTRLCGFAALTWERNAGSLDQIPDSEWDQMYLGFNEIFGRPVLSLDAVKLLAAREIVREKYTKESMKLFTDCKSTDDIVEDLLVVSRYLSVDGVPSFSSIHLALENTFWEAVVEGFIMAAPSRKKIRRSALPKYYLEKILEERSAHAARSLLMEQRVIEKEPGSMNILIQTLLKAGKLDKALKLWRGIKDKDTRNELILFVKRNWKKWEHVLLVMLLETVEPTSAARLAEEFDFSRESLFQVGRWESGSSRVIEGLRKVLIARGVQDAEIASYFSAGELEPRVVKGNIYRTAGRGRRQGRNSTSIVYADSDTHQPDLEAPPKVYKCKACPTLFASNSSLHNHCRVSNQGLEKAIICPIHPGAKFARAEEYRRHFRSIHQGNRFRCQKCKIDLCSRRGFRQHIKRKHPEAADDIDTLVTKAKKQTPRPVMSNGQTVTKNGTVKTTTGKSNAGKAKLASKNRKIQQSAVVPEISNEISVSSSFTRPTKGKKRKRQAEHLEKGVKRSKQHK